MNSSKIKESNRFGRFLVLGVLNTLIDFGLMNLFSGFFHWPLVLSQALSFLIAVVNSYYFSRAWVYADLHTRQSSVQFGKFLAINLAGLVIRSLAIDPLNSWLSALISRSQNSTLLSNQALLSRNGALAIIIPITLTLNYVANRYWTFRSENPLPQTAEIRK